MPSSNCNLYVTIFRALSTRALICWAPTKWKDRNAASHSTLSDGLQTPTPVKELRITLHGVDPALLNRVRIDSVGTSVSELWFATKRTDGPDRVQGVGLYARKTGAVTKEYLKRSCVLGWNYTTNSVDYYQAPIKSTMRFDALPLRYRRDVKPDFVLSES